MQEGNQTIQRPSQAERANGFEAIRLATSNLVSEQNASASIYLNGPTVPESPDASFNSPALPETNSEIIRHAALTDSTRYQILGVTSHDNSVDTYVGSNSKAQEDEDLADDEKEAFSVSHTSTPILSVNRDRINSKKHLKRRATRLSEEALGRLKRTRRTMTELNATYRDRGFDKRWLQYLQELKDQVQELNQKLEAIYKELAKFREWQTTDSGWLAALEKEQELRKTKELDELNQEKQKSISCIMCRELLQEL